MKALVVTSMAIAASTLSAVAHAQSAAPSWAPPGASWSPPSPSPAPPPFEPAASRGPSTTPLDETMAEDGAIDPLLPTAIAETGAGALMGVAGVVMIADARATGPERCGRIAGCIDGVAMPGADADGRMMLGAGLGLAATGGLTWAIVGGSPLEPGERRDSPGRAVAGSILLGLGASGVGAIVAGSTSEANQTGTLFLIGLAAVPSLAVGIPLLASGADVETPEETAEERAQEDALAAGAPTRAASPGMHSTGVALSIAGGTTVLAGGAMMAGASSEGDILLGLGGLVAGGTGVILLGVGIPLAVVGGRQVPDGMTASEAPEVRVGLGSIDVSGRF